MRLIRLLIFSFSMLRDGYSEDDGVMPTEKSRALMLDHFWLGDRVFNKTIFAATAVAAFIAAPALAADLRRKS